MPENGSDITNSKVNLRHVATTVAFTLGFAGAVVAQWVTVTSGVSGNAAHLVGLDARVALLETQMRALDEASVNAEQMQSRLAALEGRVRSSADTEEEDRQRLVAIEIGDREIETQLRASEQMRNMMHSMDYRLSAELWQKVFGQTLPQANYFPSVAAPAVNDGLNK
jgi:TolA-binding protein